MPHGTARPTVVVSTPTPFWAVLFLRDLWGLGDLGGIPRCSPTPSFRGGVRSPSDAELLAVESVLRSGVDGVAPVEALDVVFAAIESVGEVESWREWSQSTKRTVQSLASPLESSPSWQVGEDLAAHRPPLEQIVILPVADNYAAIHGQTLAVALTVYSNAERLRDAIRSL
jgi:hypothetical protein